MKILLDFEQLVANALINQIKNKGKDNIAFRDAYYYATKVAIKLQREGHAVAVINQGFINIKVNNLFHVDLARERLEKYSNVSLEQLQAQYRAPLSAETLNACLAYEEENKKESEG